MKTLTMALLAGAIAAAPIAASAQSHGGGGGGFHGGGGGGGGFHGGYGGYHGGYGGGWRGGYGGWRGGYGYGWGFGGFGLGLALGAAYYDPWYYGYGGYYPGYYGYYPAYYGPSAWDDDYDDYYGGPAPAQAAPPANYNGGYSAPGAGSASAQACGQWVWHADQNKYQWAPGACT